MYWRAVPVAIVILILLMGGGAAESGSGAEQDVVVEEGVVVEMGAEAESEYLEEAEQLAEQYPILDVPSEAAYFYTKDERYVLVSTDEIESGAARIDGYSLTLDSGNGVLFTDEVDVETEGQQVPYEQLNEDIGFWDAELARFTIDYGQVSIATEAGQGAIQGQSALGTRATGLDILPPGETGVFAANLTTEGGEFDDSRIEQRLPTENELRLVSLGERAYWIDTEVTLDVAIVDGEAGPMGFIVDRSFDSTQVDEVSAINSGQHDGELVTVQADTAEARISTAETLQQALPCGPDSFNIGTACIPAVTDAVVHSGVLYSSSQPSQDDLLLYTAISNAQQDQPVDVQHRNVRVTGEVVSTQEINTALPEGRAIVAYDIEYINHNQGGPPPAAVDYRDQSRSAIEEQIVESAEQDSSSGTGSESNGGDGGSGGSSQGQSSPGSEQSSSAGSSTNSEGGLLSVSLLSLVVPGLSLLFGAFSIGALSGIVVQEWKRFWKDSESDRERWRRIYVSVWLMGASVLSASISLALLSFELLVIAFPATLASGIAILAGGVYQEYVEVGVTRYNKYTSYVGIFMIFVATILLLIWWPTGGERALLLIFSVMAIVALLLATLLWVLIGGLKFILGMTDEEDVNTRRFKLAKVGAGALISLLVIIPLLLGFVDPLFSIIGLLLALLLLATGAVVRMSD